jgi:hypothetical protein
MTPAKPPLRDRTTTMTVTTTTVVETLIKVTEEVFQTMVFRQLLHKVPIEGDALRPTSNVVGTVGFAGSSNGLVAFYSTLAAARNIASAMLGMAENEIDRDALADAIGEITNMIVTIGSDFYIKPLTNGHRVLIPFGMEEHEVCVELILTEPPRRPQA